jgi:EF hand
VTHARPRDPTAFRDAKTPVAPDALPGRRHRAATLGGRRASAKRSEQPLPARFEARWHGACTDFDGANARLEGMSAKYIRWIAIALVTGCSDATVAPFPALDEDGDGRISRQEAADDEALVQRFAQADADRNGELTAIEYLEAAKR